MTKQEERNKRFDEKFGGFITLGLHNSIIQNGNLVHLNSCQDIKSFLNSEVDLAIAEERKRIVELSGYVEHRRNCILSYAEAGEPTEDGGYRQKFNGKWYQLRPVDETPKCDCGLDNLLSLINKDN